MKKLLGFSIYALSIMMSSCMPHYSVGTAIIDYKSIYDATGVAISESNSISQDYEPIGSIIAVCNGGMAKNNGNHIINKSKDPIGDDVFSENEKGENKNVYIYSTAADALMNAATAVKHRGANAIINLRIEKNINIDVVTITGMAIRIK